MWTGYQCAGSFPHKCYQRLHEGHEFQRSKTIDTPRLDYRWEPAQCILAPFHARLLADHLAEHPLLFVGDSINQLQFESLACLLGRDLESPMGDTNMTGGHPDRWVSQWVHKKYVDKPGAVTMAYLRSDYLVRLDDFKIMEPMDEEGYQIGRGSNFPWAHVLPRFDYIILNTGPHWHPDLKWGPDRSRDELLASFTEAMGVVFDYLKKNVKSHQRVWIRSTPYGHARCSRFKSPDTVPRPPTGKEGEYEWDMLEKFDHVWKQWIIDENDDRFHFLNVSLSNLRGDAHSRPDSDCLHTCLPGPVDDWNKLLYSEMARISA
ncbi:PC-esterase [Radiomyces spectabilis]|uniref:PC-esterase n=1 Tax=Radiomyces spectabilis TaxID=64574 RepID=UPI002221112B|nr:PC-esterase [Radiomyces spectabilis]KAI8388826.1 PC-esterase [Radiomyces spectabilis]